MRLTAGPNIRICPGNGRLWILNNIPEVEDSKEINPEGYQPS